MSFPLLSALATIVALYILTRRRRNNMPPGPPRDPLIGHLRYIPSKQNSLVFHEWSKKYGDVMYLEVLRQPMIVLDSQTAAIDLLDNRSANYSDRPAYIRYEMLGWTRSVTFLQYGNEFFKHRQIHQTYLARPRCAEFKLLQIQEAHTLVRNLMTCAPNTHAVCLDWFATGIMTRIITGHRISSHDDLYLHLSKMVLESMMRSGSPGSSAIDVFPILRHFPSWFPGTAFAAIAKHWRPVIRVLYKHPLETVQIQRAAGTAPPSFVLALLEEAEGKDADTQRNDEEDIKGAAATMFSAGQSTTCSGLTVFVLAMLLYPEYQVKAQQEINTVIGTARLPDFADRPDLPLVECILQEVFRWNPPLPLGVPHRCMANDTYRGMHIPGVSLMIANIKGMSLDESVYKNSASFFLERYISQPLGHGEPHFTAVFGFGRRVCPGRHLADNSLWIAIATILASCTISNTVDENGHKLVPPAIMSEGLASHPDDFPCCISPRSEKARQLVMEASHST